MALTIEEGGFRLEQVDLGDPHWDVSVKKKTKHKDGTESEEWKVLAYGVSMNYAMEKIILTRMAARHSDKVLTFQEFFEGFKKERQAVLNAFHLATIDLTKDLIKNYGNRESNKAN